MRIKDGFMLRKVGNKNIAIAVGSASEDFNGLITLNDTGVFIWKQLKKDTNEKSILENMLCEYEIDEDTAKKGITDFLQELREAGLIDE